MKTFKLLLLLILGFTISSCGDDDDPDNGNVNCNSSFSINAELADEIDAFSAAATAYGMDPSTANCNDYKDALTVYLNALSALEECAQQAGVLAEFQESIDSAQDSVDALVC